MPVPTHYDDCSTRIWPTTCRECGRRVFFLSCSCGSKVFLDEPRPPWPRHSDSCEACLVGEIGNRTGYSATKIKKWIEAQSRVRGVMVPDEARRILSARANRETGGTTTIQIVPGEEIPEGEQIDIKAEIYEVNQVNIFKRSGMSPKGLGPKLLGDVGQQPVVEIILRGHRDPDTGFQDQLPVIALKRMWQDSGVNKREMAAVTFKKRTFPNDYQIWFAERIVR